MVRDVHVQLQGLGYTACITIELKMHAANADKCARAANQRAPPPAFLRCLTFLARSRSPLPSGPFAWSLQALRYAWPGARTPAFLLVSPRPPTAQARRRTTTTTSNIPARSSSSLNPGSRWSVEAAVLQVTVSTVPGDNNSVCRRSRTAQASQRDRSKGKEKSNARPSSPVPAFDFRFTFSRVLFVFFFTTTTSLWQDGLLAPSRRSFSKRFINLRFFRYRWPRGDG
ncbi:hypothetical protein VTN00DRAFT_1843 [Thermoascus crustaceus]|uniref:uncharacterized protein n=1 Tax=Thermoascus crustaceus TaxID=5088 RepID=UPI003742402C